MANPTAAERLHQAALDACRAYTEWDQKRAAFVAAIRNDADLLWELFAPFRTQAIASALTRAANELHRKRGQETNANQAQTAPPTVQGAAEEGHRSNDDRPPLVRPPPRPTRSPSAGLTAVSEIVRLSLLDTFKINRRPIGDLTPNQALSWARGQARDVRFVRLLCFGLPPNDLIRHSRQPDDTQALYEQAVREEMGHQEPLPPMQRSAGTEARQ